MQQQYTPLPPKDFKATMDYKSKNIQRFQDDKQESMRLFSSGRDAVLMTTSLMPRFRRLSEEQAKEKILMWRKWFYTEIYGQNEDFYKQNNAAF